MQGFYEGVQGFLRKAHSQKQRRGPSSRAPLAAVLVVESGLDEYWGAGWTCDEVSRRLYIVRAGIVSSCVAGRQLLRMDGRIALYVRIK